jgi:SAM-dependent methyltransferase
MEGAGSYNRWLFKRCEPFLKGRVLEVGAGVGNITKFLLQREAVIATDVSPGYVSELRNKFGHLPNVSVAELDLSDASSVQRLVENQRADTVLSMNMLEHIENDALAVRHIFRLLNPGGRLVLLVPAHQALFSDMDRSLGHFRRYDKEGLSALLESAGFRLREVRYLNWLGAIGWLVNGRILRRKLIPSRQLRLFDFLIVLLKLESYFQLPCGLSLLVTAEKPD